MAFFFFLFELRIVLLCVCVWTHSQTPNLPQALPQSCKTPLRKAKQHTGNPAVLFLSLDTSLPQPCVLLQFGLMGLWVSGPAAPWLNFFLLSHVGLNSLSSSLLFILFCWSISSRFFFRKGACSYIPWDLTCLKRSEKEQRWGRGSWAGTWGAGGPAPPQGGREEVADRTAEDSSTLLWWSLEF